jgi:hypothetical protein
MRQTTTATVVPLGRGPSVATSGSSRDTAPREGLSRYAWIGAALLIALPALVALLIVAGSAKPGRTHHASSVAPKVASPIPHRR